jgi:hypothetical protein
MNFGVAKFPRKHHYVPRFYLANFSSLEGAGRDSRAERELQSRSEEFVQGSSGGGFDQARPVRTVLRSFSRQRLRPEMARLTQIPVIFFRYPSQPAGQ